MPLLHLLDQVHGHVDGLGLAADLESEAVGDMVAGGMGQPNDGPLDEGTDLRKLAQEDLPALSHFLDGHAGSFSTRT
jgi:hypothetical protein